MSEIEIKRAVILAGGKGTRLRPYTVVVPKPLMPIGEFPILEIIIRQLNFYGFKHITLAVNHQADLIKAFFQNGSKWGVKIDYSLEDQPLGTMGPLKVINNLPENFLIMNGDILSDINYQELYEHHCKSKSTFTISSCVRNNKIDYGVLHSDQNNCLIKLEEKPSLTYQVSMGIYVASSSILDFIPAETHFGFDDLMSVMLKRNFPVNLHNFNGYWLDIGRPDDYAIAIEEFEKVKSKFLL